MATLTRPLVNMYSLYEIPPCSLVSNLFIFLIIHHSIQKVFLLPILYLSIRTAKTSNIYGHCEKKRKEKEKSL